MKIGRVKRSPNMNAPISWLSARIMPNPGTRLITRNLEFFWKMIKTVHIYFSFSLSMLDVPSAPIINRLPVEKSSQHIATTHTHTQSHTRKEKKRGLRSKWKRRDRGRESTCDMWTHTHTLLNKMANKIGKREKKKKRVNGEREKREREGDSLLDLPPRLTHYTYSLTTFLLLGVESKKDRVMSLI